MLTGFKHFMRPIVERWLIWGGCAFFAGLGFSMAAIAAKSLRALLF